MGGIAAWSGPCRELGPELVVGLPASQATQASQAITTNKEQKLRSPLLVRETTVLARGCQYPDCLLFSL